MASICQCSFRRNVTYWPRPYLPREKEDMGQYYNSIIKCNQELQECGKQMVEVMLNLIIVVN